MQVADWSVVGLGGVLVVLGLAVRTRPGGAPEGRLRVAVGRMPLFVGVAMVLGTLPRLLGAPYAAVMTLDAVSLASVCVAGALLLRAVRRPEVGA
jgi:hypothetical protein